MELQTLFSVFYILYIHVVYLFTIFPMNHNKQAEYIDVPKMCSF